MEKTESMGELIGELRKDRGWSRRQLAERAGVSGQYVWLIESGRKTNPSLGVLRSLADALGVSVVALID